MARYAVIRNSDSIVIACIEWNSTTPYTYPEPDVTLVQTNIGNVGNRYENGNFYDED